MDKAVVLVSGGLNSAVLAAIAREQYEEHLLHVAWGHRAAERERSCFEAIAAHLRIERTLTADLGWIASLGGNSRTSRKIPMEEPTSLGKEVPSTFVLGLVPAMLAAAATWAGAIGAKRILIGTSEDHGVPGPAMSSFYPDYRREFVQTFNLMLEYAKPHGRELLVEAPLAELARQEVVLLAKRLKLPVEKTWSCYRDNDEPCGKCVGCTTRAAGFLRANIPDPLLLEPAKV
ncbi:MAG TPA: 7-cyano-7-deazaguanine synthase [Phycisphaerae bacterium]|nr:7-cyano-7-deazaguanine synthase [Phycisphaerae bacterium]HPU26051.1 7-cyano-7-deazaguanine synthase [Phycisphaerae bacterium]HQA00085.1 7-cyano-7-deazaguanine synthase [Phycisphaerae bacterium]